jgi:hypothetical protein
MTSKKPYWFELADTDQSTPRPRSAKRNFPLLAAASLGVVVLSGSLLLNTHEEPTASAAVSPISTQSTTASHAVVSSAPAVQKTPAIAPVTQTSATRGDDEGNRERENDDV